MSAFEAELGTRLFDRSPQGVTLTNEGAELLIHAERIEHEAQTMLARIGGQEALLSGVVRVAVPEAFGHFLVTPMLARFRAEHPDIVIELIPETRQISLSRRDADLIVSITRPRRGRMFINKLAEFRMGIYGAPSYLERCGHPQTLRDLRDHDLVGFIDDLLQTEDFAPLAQLVDDPRLAFRSNSIVFQQNAIVAGTGLGLLHSFAAQRTPELVELLAGEFEVRRTYWTLVHSDLRRIPRIRAVIRFLQRVAREATTNPAEVPVQAQSGESGALAHRAAATLIGQRPLLDDRNRRKLPFGELRGSPFPRNA
jgi:DNA-binding transcriptional LysR family regulator